MKKKKRRGRRHRARVREARPTVMDTTHRAPEFPHPSVRVIERSPPARVSVLAERHRYALAGVKRSLVIGGAMLLLLVVLYLLLG